MKSKRLIRDTVGVQWIPSAHVGITLILENFKRVINEDFSHFFKIFPILNHDEFKFSKLFGVVQFSLERCFKGWCERLFTGLANIVGNVSNSKVLNEHSDQIGLTSCKEHVTRCRNTCLEVVGYGRVFTGVQGLETVVPP